MLAIRMDPCPCYEAPFCRVDPADLEFNVAEPSITDLCLSGHHAKRCRRFNQHAPAEGRPESEVETTVAAPPGPPLVVEVPPMVPRNFWCPTCQQRISEDEVHARWWDPKRKSGGGGPGRIPEAAFRRGVELKVTHRSAGAEEHTVIPAGVLA